MDQVEIIRYTDFQVSGDEFLDTVLIGRNDDEHFFLDDQQAQITKKWIE